MVKPEVDLTCTYCNAYFIMARTSSALQQAGLEKQACEFFNKAFDCRSIEEMLDLCREYCTVVE